MGISKIEEFLDKSSEQKILLSAIVIMLAAFASGSTLGAFNDMEMSQNTFQTGQIDLQFAWETTYNGQLLESSGFTNQTPIFNLDDVKPGDNGSARIRLKIFDNPSTMYIKFNKTADSDRTCVDPELDYEPNCTPSSTGELDENLVKTAWIDEDGDYEKDVNETEVSLNESWTPVTTSGGLLKVFGSETKYLVMEWELPENTTNEVQTDTLEYTLAFKAQQARNVNNTEDFEEGPFDGNETGDSSNDQNETDGNQTGTGDTGDNQNGTDDDNQTGTGEGTNNTDNQTGGPNSTDNRPFAEFSYTPNSPVTGQGITFNASNSTDDNQIISYEWDWTSDGTYDDTEENQTHTYSTDGDKNVTLRVTDSSGQNDTESKIVSVASSSNSGNNNGGSTNNNDNTNGGGSAIPTSLGGSGVSSDSGTIRFNLTNGQTPLEDITVTADNNGSDSDTSDGDGIALLNLPEGTYEFTFEGDGYETRTGSYEIVAGQTRSFQIEMNPTDGSGEGQLSDLLVSVVDSNTEGIEDANVSLNNSMSETTDNLGLARFTLSSGTYQINVEAGGYESNSTMAQVQKEDDATVELQLESVEQQQSGGNTADGNQTQGNILGPTGQLIESPTGATAAGFFLLLLLILFYMVYRRYG